MTRNTSGKSLKDASGKHNAAARRKCRFKRMCSFRLYPKNDVHWHAGRSI